MATGTPYTPPPLATSVVAIPTQSPARSLSYVSPTQYRFAPTAVSTDALVPKSTNPDTDSLASLADVLSRASGWADLIAFEKPQGDFVASSATETMWTKVKPDGSLAVSCNQAPVLEITALALGGTPGSLSSIDPNTAADLWINDRIITVPWAWNAGLTPYFPRPVGPGGGVFVAWSYVAGYPHTSLASSANAGATSLDLTPAAGTTIAGIYPGSVLNIIDQSSTEAVTVTGLPSGNTVPCTALANFHSPPSAPDFIPVSAIPKPLEEAVILLTNVLIKTRGSRAFVMPGSPGGVPSHTAMAQSGSLDDYENACRMLHKFRIVTIHG